MLFNLYISNYHSRGNFFIYQLIQGKANLYENELHDIAPFTLLSFCLHTQVITQNHWDGLHLKRSKRIMSTPFILCSNSLYENAIKKKLKAEFNSLIANKSEIETTTRDVINPFHQYLKLFLYTFFLIRITDLYFNFWTLISVLISHILTRAMYTLHHTHMHS